MLVDWFVTAALRLSPAAAETYLDILSALREPADRSVLVTDAIDELCLCETGLMLYALPSVLAAHRRLSGIPAVKSSAERYFEELVAVAGLDGAAAELRAAFDVLDESASALAARLTALAAKIRVPDQTLEHNEPYHDLVVNPLGTITIALLEELVLRHPGEARDWLRSSPTVLSQAHEGRYGRLPFLVSIRAVATVDRSPETVENLAARLSAYGGTAADLEPDLLDAMARLRFGTPGTAHPPEVGALAAEAATGIELAKWRAKPPAGLGGGEDVARTRAYARLGGAAKGLTPSMPAVLWQSTLWALAAETDAVATAQTLRQWWQPPPRLPNPARPMKIVVPCARGYEGAFNHLSALVRLRGPRAIGPFPNVNPQDGPLGEGDPDTVALLGSPWLHRNNPDWDLRPKAKSVFPRCKEADQLVRVCAAAVLAVGLVRTLAVPEGDAPEHDHLFALLLHLGDVRTDSPLRSRGPEKEFAALPPPLQGLLRHATNAVDRAGQGEYPTITPARVVRFVTAATDSSEKDQAPTQWRNLFRFAAQQVAVRWLEQVRSGGVGSRADRRPDWFNGTEPAARVLLRAAVDQGDRTATRGPDPARAVLLIRELYPDEPVRIDKWDWYGSREERAKAAELSAGVLRLNDVMLSPEYAVGVWEAMEPQLARWVDEGAATAMQTVRLAALLKDPESGDRGDHRDWVTSWLDTVGAINERRLLARTVRQRMVELLRAPVTGDGSEERVQQVGARVIETILDLSGDAQFYYHRLFAALAEDLSVGDAVANEWRALAMAILYRRHRDGAGFEPASPFVLDRERDMKALTDRAVRRLAFSTARRRIESQDATLGEAIDVLWRSVSSRPALAAAPAHLTEVEDAAAWRAERLLVATNLDSYGDRLVRYPLDLDPEWAVVDGGDDERVTDLFLAHDLRRAWLDKLAQRGTPVFGVVCAVDRRATSRAVWVNCGLGEPLRRALQPGQEMPEIGDPVAVKLTGGPEIGAGPVLRLRPAKVKPGEVLPATVRAIPDHPWLSVVVAGRDVYPGKDTDEEIATRLLWDPDLSRRFGTAPVGDAWETLARWDESAGQWLPVDRGMTELIAGELSSDDAIGEAVLTFAGAAHDVPGADGPALRFVTRPGCCYLLHRSDWTEAAWDRVRDLVADDTPGLRLRVTADAVTAGLALCGDADPATGGAAVDERNRRWLNLFAEGESETLVAERRAGVWWLPVKAVPGFPDEVRASGLDRVDADRCLCSVGSWEEPQARAAQAGVSVLAEEGIVDVDDVDVERYRELRQSARGAVVALTDVARTSLRRDGLSAFTEAGLPVRVPTESAALAVGDQDLRGFFRGRWAEVQSDRTFPFDAERRAVRPARPVTVEDLLEKIGAGDEDELAEIQAALTGRAGVEGLVVGTLRDRSRVAFHVLWLDLDDRIAVVTVPESALEVPGDDVSVGDHVAGVASAGGWVFGVSRRMLTARGLYRWVEHPGADWVGVGYFGDPGDRTLVYQNPQGPEIACGPGTWTARQSRVQDVSRRRWIWAGESYMRVAVKWDNEFHVGDALEDADPSGLRLRFPLLRIRQVGDVDGTPWVDVHREFVLEAVTPSGRQRSSDIADRTDERRWERWRAALAAGHGHLVGVRRGQVFHTSVEAPQSDGTWARTIPLLPGEEPLVLGRSHYDSAEIRVRVVPDGDACRASFATAEPLAVTEFAERIALVADGRPHRLLRRVYYVGDETVGEQTVHRFEWGPGWVVDVPADALFIGGKPVHARANSLFHGDLVRALAVRPAAEGATGPAVHLAVKDIVPMIEGQLHREASGRWPVVHEIEVCVDVARGRVAVLRVHSRNHDSERQGELSTKDHPVTAARLDPGDADRLVAAARKDPRRTGDTVTWRILARLKTDHDIARCGRVSEFAHVPAATGLRADDVLYLEAAKIKDANNDLYLEFRLPQDVREPQGNPLIVRVRRRRFSHQETLLRRQLTLFGEDAYKGSARMLVKLEDRGRQRGTDRNIWPGNTLQVPLRRQEVLLGYLRQRGGSCIVTVGDGSRIEVAPSVHFDASRVAGRADMAAGTLARLSDSGTGLRLEVALPPQRRYLRHRRPVVVFPKNPLLREGGLARSGAWDSFTISGLSAVEATASDSCGTALLHTGHPKIAEASLDERNRVRLGPAGDQTAAVTLDASQPSGPAVLTRLAAGPGAPAGPLSVPWARMSFADGSVEELIRRCRAGRWHHHDRSTGHWEPDGAAAVPDAVADPATMETDPVFLADDKGWTLRYPARELPRYAFPATELLDHTDILSAAGGESGQEAWLTVAGTSGPPAKPTGLWIEASPGRIVEVPAGLFAAGEASLGRLDWSLFSAGDRIRISVPRGSNNDHVALGLLGWEPGLRGAFGGAPRQSRLLAPVGFALPEEGALLLGAGRDVVKYPAQSAVIERHPVGSAVWLDQRNDVSPLSDSEVRDGDIVLLGIDNGTGDFVVHGLPRRRVRLAAVDKDTWPGSRWLYDALTDPVSRRTLVNQLGGSLAVTVEPAADAETDVVVVSRRHQPAGWWPRGKVLRTEVAADLGGGTLMLRSGSALFRVTADQIFPGTDDPARIASALTQRPTPVLWWRISESGEVAAGLPTTGSDSGSGSGSGSAAVKAQLVRTVAEGSHGCAGLICRDLRSQALCWLPAETASWVPGLSADQLTAHFGAANSFPVIRLAGSRVSVTGQPMVRREWSLIRVGSTLSAIVCDAGEPDAAGRHRHLARTRFTGVLLTVITAKPLRTGAELVAEVCSVQTNADRQPAVVCVPAGTRTAALDLPRWLIGQLGRLTVTGPAVPDPVPDDLIPERFPRYAVAYEDGLWDDAAISAGADVDEQIVRAAGTARRTPADPRLGPALAAWLRAGGLHAARGQGECDVAPLLAAVLVSAAVGRSDPGAARLAVFLAHQLGRRAARSAHSEPLVTQWLRDHVRMTAPGGWRRLRTVAIAPEMDLASLQTMLDFCGAVLAKPVVETEDERAPVARALLAAAGRLPSAAQLGSDAPLLAPVAAWARALTPREGRAVAQDALLDHQVDRLRQLARDVIAGGVPLTLLAPGALPAAALTLLGEWEARTTGDSGLRRS